MKILIIGAGIGGLSLANFCKKSGIDYEIIEKQKDQSHHGFSLGMWNNGRRMLQKLGLSEEFDKRCVPFRHMNIYNGKKELVNKYDFKLFFQNYGMGYFHIQRKDLIEWLSKNISENEIFFDTTVKSMENDKEKISVTFSNGKIKEYDLVVGADGINSEIRETFFKGSYKKFINWRAWYVKINSKYTDSFSVATYVEPSQYIVTFDEGTENSLAVMVAHENHTIWDSKEKRMETLMKLFSKEKYLIPDILINKDEANILPTDLCEIETDVMFKDRLVLLGDAAHGFEPFAGLGGSMAMEDAYILVGELSSKKSIKDALLQYDFKRRKRIKKAFTITKKMKYISIIKSKFLRFIVNKLLSFSNDKIITRDFLKFLNEEI